MTMLTINTVLDNSTDEDDSLISDCLAHAFARTLAS